MRAFHSVSISSHFDEIVWRDRSGRMFVKERNKFHSNISGDFRPRNVGATVSLRARRAQMEKEYVTA
jgi:hypothetical protein